MKQVYWRGDGHHMPIDIFDREIFSDSIKVAEMYGLSADMSSMWDEFEEYIENGSEFLDDFINEIIEPVGLSCQFGDGGSIFLIAEMSK